MYFSEFSSLCYELEKMPSRLAKIAAASAYLKRLNSDEIRFGVSFLSGRPFPVSDPRTLDIGAAAFYDANEQLAQNVQATGLPEHMEAGQASSSERNDSNRELE